MQLALAGRLDLRGFTRYLKNVKTSVGIAAWTFRYTSVLLLHFETLTGTFIISKAYFFPHNFHIFIKQNTTGFILHLQPLLDSDLTLDRYFCSWHCLFHLRQSYEFQCFAFLKLFNYFVVPQDFSEEQV